MIKIDTIYSIKVRAMFFDENYNPYPREICIKQICDNNLLDYFLLLNEFGEEIERCENFNTGDKSFEVKDLNSPDIIDHLLEVVDSLAYKVSCYKHPDHYSHEEDKKDILIDAGLRKELIKTLTE